MDKFIQQSGDYVAWIFESLWDWLLLLNQEEWVLLLAIVSICGFLCMRGFGSRHNY